jgi:hypothetical protein
MHQARVGHNIVPPRQARSIIHDLSHYFFRDAAGPLSS